MRSTIYFLCHDNKMPTGGNKIIYRHAAILNECGFNCRVLHHRENFSYSQLEHRPPTQWIGNTIATRHDILVIPEDYGNWTNRLAPGIPKIIFNQNAYYSFKGYNLSSRIDDLPYRHPEVIGTITVSADNQLYICTGFADITAYRVHLSVNQRIFFYQPWQGKEKIISFMTRKNYGDIVQVIKLLESRGNIVDFRIKPIENRSEQEVGEILRKSMIFLSFAHPEGLSLANLEALFCGCQVIGYHGRGGIELFREPACTPVEVGDIIGFVEAVENICQQCRDSPQEAAYTSKISSKSVAYTFSESAECLDLVNCYSKLMLKAQHFVRTTLHEKH